MSKLYLHVSNNDVRLKVAKFFKTSPLTEFETCFKLRDKTFEMTADNLNDEQMLRNVRMEMDILSLEEWKDYKIVMTGEMIEG